MRENMNRIILIGNGFDLAHGLKTSYKHFIDDFWETRKEKVISYHAKRSRNYSFIYEDDIINIRSHLEFTYLPKDTNRKGYDWFNDLFNTGRAEVINGILLESKITHKNTFLKTISIKNSIQNWVDVEEEYYLALNRCLQNEDHNLIEQLNKEFLMIQTALEEYLKIQTTNQPSKSIQIEQWIYWPLVHDDIPRELIVKNLNNILYLNFNYTSTEKLYIKNSDKVIHIHGELDNPENPIVFGYGDELDDKYKLIEQMNDNDYLENIKSIKYLETRNYKDLLAFMDSDKYQIYVMGHSCGISDRTLLNTLFEHENCFSIKVFYHDREDGTDNYSDIIRNISRNFTKKSLMRKIVVDKTGSKPL
jgi:hypothetical protein